ncbi:MAG: GatB/YqeY domain-containing protein [Candidatus Firestonebacteria bacterium]
MGLKEKLDEDLKAAMKAADQAKLSAIRLLKTSIMNGEIQKNKAFTDEDIFPLIQTAIKQRKDSFEQYTKGNRPELAEKEAAEVKILEVYLPAQMDEAQVKELVDKAIKETGAVSLKDIGKVMGKLMPLVKGKADGGLVNRLVREALTVS